MEPIHIVAEKEKVAEKVLLPGDPLRAKFIAETYLEDVECYNKVRGMYGFTGTYKGKKVSVQGTGMGMPSMSIYANELIQFYGAKNLIRVGTCGSMNKDLHIKDIVLAIGASTDSNMNNFRFRGVNFSATANFELLNKAYKETQLKDVTAVVGNIFTTDKFYNDDIEKEKINLLSQYGVVATDMETAELYTVAAKYGVKALTLMTVSDSLVTSEVTTAEERQTSFKDMIEIALEII